MSSLKDLLKKALGGRNPEEALTEFKENMHQSINDFYQDPKSQVKVRQYLEAIMKPLRYFNIFVVRPHMSNPTKLKALAKKYQMNKIELKRFFKISLELEERLKRYFGDDLNFAQLVITLRKVINILDEQLVTDLIDAMDYNIDFAKIEKAYITYQDSLQSAYNTAGLKNDIQNIMGTFMGNFKRSIDPKRTTYRASDRVTETRMLEPALQNTYDHYREEGYTHDEAMIFVNEKADMDNLPKELWPDYRKIREAGKSHKYAIKKLMPSEEATADTNTANAIENSTEETPADAMLENGVEETSLDIDTNTLTENSVEEVPLNDKSSGVSSETSDTDRSSIEEETSPEEPLETD